MKEKADNLIKTPSKIQSFEEVQKALQDLAKQLNDLGIATNSGAEGEVTDKDGKTGDIRITQNEDKTYGLELKTEEGWKFPTVGESPVQLTGKKGEKARPDAVVDKFKDELGNPSNFPKPDYESEWYNIPDEWVVEFTHGLGVIPTFVTVLVTNDGGETVHRNWDTTSGHGYEIIYTKTYIWIPGAAKWGWIYNTLEWADKNVKENNDQWDAVDYYIAGGTQEWQFKVQAWK